MHARNLSAGPGDPGTDLDETRRRFLFAREHLAAHAPGATRRPGSSSAAGRPDDDPAAGRAFSERAA